MPSLQKKLTILHSLNKVIKHKGNTLSQNNGLSVNLTQVVSSIKLQLLGTVIDYTIRSATANRSHRASAFVVDRVKIFLTSSLITMKNMVVSHVINTTRAYM